MRTSPTRCTMTSVFRASRCTFSLQNRENERVCGRRRVVRQGLDPQSPKNVKRIFFSRKFGFTFVP